MLSIREKSIPQGHLPNYGRVRFAGSSGASHSSVLLYYS